jgi:hypothetical protein
MKTLILLGAITVFTRVGGLDVFERGTPFDTSKCSLSASTISEIKSYKSIANTIVAEGTQNSFKHKTYTDLRYFVDTFGPRPTGGAQLEKSLEFLEKKTGRT